MSSVSDTSPSPDPVTRPDRTFDDSADERRTPARQLLREHLFSATSPLWIFGVLVVLVLVFGLDKPSAFFASENIRTMFVDAALALLLSVGMTYVIITAGIDLSVGSVLVCAGVLAAKVMIAVGGGSGGGALNAGWGTILLGCAVGLAVGLA